MGDPRPRTATMPKLRLIQTNTRAIIPPMGSTATRQTTPPRRSRQRPDRCSIPSQMRSISSHSCIKSSQIRTKTSQAPDRKRNKMEQNGTLFRPKSPRLAALPAPPGSCPRWPQRPSPTQIGVPFRPVRRLGSPRTRQTSACGVHCGPEGLSLLDTTPVCL